MSSKRVVFAVSVTALLLLLFEIRAIRLDDVQVAAAMHFEFFGGPEVTRSSMLKLGPKFLETVFYRLNLDNPYFFALGAFMGGNSLDCRYSQPTDNSFFGTLCSDTASNFCFEYCRLLLIVH